MRIKKCLLFVAMVMTVAACTKTEQFTPNHIPDQEANLKLLPLTSTTGSTGIDPITGTGGTFETGEIDPLIPISELTGDGGTWASPNLGDCNPPSYFPFLVSPYRSNNTLYFRLFDNPNDNVSIANYTWQVWSDGYDTQLFSGEGSVFSFDCDYEQVYNIVVITNYSNSTNFCFVTNSEPESEEEEFPGSMIALSQSSTGVDSSEEISLEEVYLNFHYDFINTTTFCENTETISNFAMVCDDATGALFTFIIPD